MKHQNCGNEMVFFKSNTPTSGMVTNTYACKECREYVEVRVPAQKISRYAYNIMRYGSEEVALALEID